MRFAIYQSLFVCFFKQILLCAGAAVDTADKNGWTALMWSIENGQSQVAEVSSLVCFCHNQNTLHTLKTFFVE